METPICIQLFQLVVLAYCMLVSTLCLRPKNRSSLWPRTGPEAYSGDIGRVKNTYKCLWFQLFHAFSTNSSYLYHLDDLDGSNLESVRSEAMPPGVIISKQPWRKGLAGGG